METKKESAALAVILLSLFVLFFAARMDWSGNQEIQAGEPGQTGNLSGDAVVPSRPVASEQGEKVFRQNCAVCHSLGTNKITGPGLQGIGGRVPSREWMAKWIRNNAALIASGDPYAVKVSSFDPSQMTIFNSLSDEEINEVIKYITGN